jgi:hypothetical protein
MLIYSTQISILILADRRWEITSLNFHLGEISVLLKFQIKQNIKAAD